MNKNILISFLKKNAAITFDALDEDIPVKGNAMCSGDDKLDMEVENEIIERLNNGDLSAWFCAKVTAEYLGFKYSDYLGACSYRSFAEFINGDYYADMIDSACVGLAELILSKKDAINMLNKQLGE